MARRAGRWMALAHELGMPGIAVSRIVNSLEAAKLLTLTDDEHLLPARDLGQISLQEILDIARNEKAGQVAPRSSNYRRWTRSRPRSTKRGARVAAR